MNKKNLLWIIIIIFNYALSSSSHKEILTTIKSSENKEASEELNIELEKIIDLTILYGKIAIDIGFSDHYQKLVSAWKKETEKTKKSFYWLFKSEHDKREDLLSNCKKNIGIIKNLLGKKENIRKELLTKHSINNLDDIKMVKISTYQAILSVLEICNKGIEDYIIELKESKGPYLSGFNHNPPKEKLNKQSKSDELAEIFILIEKCQTNQIESEYFKSIIPIFEKTTEKETVDYVIFLSEKYKKNIIEYEALYNQKKVKITNEIEEINCQENIKEALKEATKKLLEAKNKSINELLEGLIQDLLKKDNY